MPEDGLSIGRGRTNTVSIPDGGLSRHHCEIVRSADRYLLRDLGSTNGTAVNGLPTSERLLESGDQIHLSDSAFLFTSEAAPDATRFALDGADEDRSLSAAETRLGEDEVLRLQGGSVLPLHLPADRLARELSALFRVSAALASESDPVELQRRLLEGVSEAIPAARGGFVTPAEEDDGHLLICRDREAAEALAPRLSGALVEEVLRDGAAVLRVSPSVGDGPAGSKRSEAAAVLCAPLTFRDKRLGVLYLESGDPACPFDEHHLRWLVAVAGSAAAALAQARHLEWLREENRRLASSAGLEHDMLGNSRAMQEVFAFIARAAPAESTILITGENGTGKELAARAIHRNSRRAREPFVALNCATLTETLLASELFGHERGAFTGAVASKKGKFELAHRGTLLLDEVGELALDLQARLLRVLQEGEVERVGGTRTIAVDVRILASTNRDLAAAVEQGAFRRDLYHRLDVLQLRMPPLRRRGADLALLTDHFVKKHARRCGRPVMGVSAEARRCLSAYSWPGNVRELQNAIERAVVLGTGEEVTLDDLPETLLESAEPPPSEATFHDLVRARKKELVGEALELTGGNHKEAAERLGINRTYLHRLVRNLGLRGASED